MATDPTPTPGTLVRFNHERKGGPVHRIASVARDGMIELEDMGGFFAPHLFEIAGDIADIPPTIPNRRDFLVMELRAEIERLRAALRAARDNIMDEAPDSALAVIRDALAVGNDEQNVQETK